MTDIGLELLVLLALTLVNAFFSGAEIAILAVRKTRLRELADEGRRAAQLALTLRGDPERFLATVQVGITVVGASAGAFGGAVLEAPVAAVLQRVGVTRGAEQIAFVLVVAFVSVLSVVVGELVPKSLSLRHAERVALLVSIPLYRLAQLSRPVIWFLTAASNVLLRPFEDETTFTETRLSPEELRQLVGEAAQAGTLDEDTGEIASRAIDLAGLEAFSVMVPRAGIVWLPLTATREEVRRKMREQPHARYPVSDDADQPLGYVVAHDVYTQLLEGTLDLRALLREIPTFPEQASATDALHALRRARSEIGLVVDETGAVTGLLSIETVAEQLFGEILGEREMVVADIVAVGEGRWDVRGTTPIHEVNRALGLDLPISPTASTMAGLVLARLGSFPSPGARVELAAGVVAEVTETRARRVLRVTVQM